VTTLLTHTPHTTNELGVSIIELNWRVPLSNEWAQAVIGMFRQTYGERYHSAYITTPQALQQARERTRSLTFLALTPCGEIIGHAGLARSAPGLGKYERAVVSERYRGLGIGKLLLGSALEAARGLSLELVWAEAITSRAASERLLTSYGFQPVGIHLGKFNDYFNVGCRESTIVLAKPLSDESSLGIGGATSAAVCPLTAREPLAALQASLYREMSQLELTLGTNATPSTLKRALVEKERVFSEEYLSIAINEKTASLGSILREVRKRGYIFASQLPFSPIQRFQRFKSLEWEYLQAKTDLSSLSRTYINEVFLQYFPS
jgi:GNAT superfamily N-acetyltransferase